MHCRTVFFIFFLLGIVGLAAGQNEIRGRVMDAGTGEPLAFVHVVVEDTQTGGLTDIDGFFHISHERAIEYLQLSYVGYHRKRYYPGEEDVFHFIRLASKAIELEEVVVTPGENPAHRIVANAIANRSNHHPENLASFSYRAYNKFVFTGELDSPDQDPGEAEEDTVAFNLSTYLEEHHFFLMETVTERKYLAPGRNNEKVLASRISGVEHPMFALFMSQMQSFSFYFY